MNHHEFLNHLFTGTTGYFDITGIHPVKDACYTRCYRIGHDRVNWDDIMRANAAGWGIYYGATVKSTPRQGYKRGTEKTASMLSCLWAEVDLKDGDYPDLDAIKLAIYDLPQPATVITASGGGIHALWRIAPIEITSDNRHIIKEVLRGLAVYLKADTKATDLARVLRLPSTINTKPERNGARCEVIDALPGELRFEDFTDYRQYAKPIERPIQRDLPRYKPDELPRTVSDYLSTPLAVGGRNDALNKAAFVLHSNGYDRAETERLLVPKALSDGLAERAILATINSAYNASPGTPSYINQRTQARMRAGDAIVRSN
jgi:hypothetical protein